MFLSSCVMACVPQYLSDVLGDLSRGSGQFVPKTRSAIEHLTRSRRNCRTPESFSCRFLSWPVRERPPACLYAIPGRVVAPSGNLRHATPVPKRVSGSVAVNACPSMCSLCSRKAICTGNLGTERREARKVPAGHLASVSLRSRRPAPESRPMNCTTSLGGETTAQSVSQRKQERRNYGNGSSPSSFKNVLCFAVAARISPSSSTCLPIGTGSNRRIQAPRAAWAGDSLANRAGR